jgi:glycosyltransferase involved in cell wall biosynthesis
MTIDFGILSTYPPTQCGLATFSASLLRALTSAGSEVGVVSVVDTVDRDVPNEVSHQWVRSDPHGANAAAAALRNFDVAVIQHEYGIFPGRDGMEVLDVARALDRPIITVLHTVLTQPSHRQRVILEQLGRQSVALVVMTETGRQRLIDGYDVDPDRVTVIPHGSADIQAVQPGAELLTDRPAVLTWGLLGEGKGIEWAIDAMAQLVDIDPRPCYYVVGETHPRVLEQFGERYRERLIHRAADAGISDMVRFDARYLDNSELHRIVRQADVVLLPYDSVDQVTSGVLIEAVAAGKPVVSTGFPHARELLAGGAGLLVDRQDPAAIAGALRRVLTEPGVATTMAGEARRIAPCLLWSSVADRYQELALAALRPTTFAASA